MKVKLLKQLRKKACSLVQVSYDCERNEYKIISRYISHKPDNADTLYYKKGNKHYIGLKGNVKEK